MTGHLMAVDSAYPHARAYTSCFGGISSDFKRIWTDAFSALHLESKSKSPSVGSHLGQGVARVIFTTPLPGGFPRHFIAMA